LYCYCRKPSSKDLIGCDFCPQWYHPTCLNLSDESVKIILSLPTWRCPECENIIQKTKKKHNQIFLPIPHGGKFCEIKTTRLESWGLDDYQKCGWVPVNDNKWIPLKNIETVHGGDTDRNMNNDDGKSRRRHRKSVVPFDNSKRRTKKSKAKQNPELQNQTDSLGRDEKVDKQVSTCEYISKLSKTKNNLEVQNQSDSHSLGRDEIVGKQISTYEYISKLSKSRKRKFASAGSPSGKKLDTDSEDTMLQKKVKTSLEKEKQIQKPPRRNLRGAPKEAEQETKKSVEMRRVKVTQKQCQGSKVTVGRNQLQNGKGILDKENPTESNDQSQREATKKVVNEKEERNSLEALPEKGEKPAGEILKQNQAKIVVTENNSDLDRASTSQIRVDMKDSNISLEKKRGTIIENKSESGANEGNFYDELFFCYNCKSIFVSEVALEEHQERMH